MTTPLIIGWALTFVGVAGSIGYNIFNHVQTRKVRNSQHRAAQWERIRNRIESALTTLVDAGKLLRHHHVGDQKYGDALEYLNRLIADAHDDLCAALEEASPSTYCNGIAWREAAHGPKVGTETAWDLILTLIVDAQTAPTVDDRVKALDKIQIPINQIRATVLEMCRVEDIEHDPERL